MINIANKQECCGCEACVQVCSKHCISFKEDGEGFCYPKLDVSQCVDCGLCTQVCPVLNRYEERLPIKSLAARNLNDSERQMSSSGGVFILLAKAVIRQGGVVFGARFDEKWNVVHGYAETEEGIEVFMGSKYVQSRIGNTYVEARAFLKEGRIVLFTGTSCQIAGLKRYLRRNYDNLLTVDVICHGVPSPKIWQSYVQEIKENARKDENSVSLHPSPSLSEKDTLVGGDEIKIESIYFRDKRLGWKKYSFALTLAKASAAGKKNTVSLSTMHREDPYMMAFIRNLIIRPSCYHCPAKSGRSNSDITIADFWGIQTMLPGFDDDKGTSLVIVNTTRGLGILDTLGLETQEVNMEKAIQGNGVYYNPVKPHCQRKRFFKAFERGQTGIASLLTTYTKIPLYCQCKTVMQRIGSKIYRDVRYLITKDKDKD